MLKVFENEKFLVESASEAGELAENELRITVKASGQALHLDADREGIVLTGLHGDRFCLSTYIGNDPDQLPWMRISRCK